MFALCEITFCRGGNTILGDYGVYRLLCGLLDSLGIVQPDGLTVEIVDGLALRTLTENLGLWRSCVRAAGDSGLRKVFELSGCSIRPAT